MRLADGSYPVCFGCQKAAPVAARVRRDRRSASRIRCRRRPRWPERCSTQAGFVGVAGVEAKRHAETGERWFLEVNVRVPAQWGLGDACGAEAEHAPRRRGRGARAGPAAHAAGGRRHRRADARLDGRARAAGRGPGVAAPGAPAEAAASVPASARARDCSIHAIRDRVWPGRAPSSTADGHAGRPLAAILDADRPTTRASNYVQGVQTRLDNPLGRYHRGPSHMRPRLLTSLILGFLLVSPATAQAANWLYPNMRTLPPRELRFDRTDVSADSHGDLRNVLRFSNTVYNTGEGPVEIRATINPRLNPPSGPAVQRIYDDQGGHMDIPLSGSTLYYHAVHVHYHFDHWGGYELWTRAGVRRLDRERQDRRQTGPRRPEDDELRRGRGVRDLGSVCRLALRLPARGLHARQKQRDRTRALLGLGRHVRLLPLRAVDRPRPGHARRRDVRPALRLRPAEPRLREPQQGRRRA